MILKTAHKIALATTASRAILFARRLAGMSALTDTRRHGIRWHLDLREGIDFSIYVLGTFEPRTVRAYERLVREGNTVLDIGANIGAHTLPLAHQVGLTGRVVAFEPTAFAFGKLRHNISLNPALAPRIVALQYALGSGQAGAAPHKLFSSWPLSKQADLHAKHKGKAMTTEGSSAKTLDDTVLELDLQRVDFIKIDVDGHELPVLQCGVQAIERFRPAILIEFSPYVHAEEGYSFDELVRFLTDRGYVFRDANSGKRLPSDPAALQAMIPDGGGINAIGRVVP